MVNKSDSTSGLLLWVTCLATAVSVPLLLNAWSRPVMVSSPVEARGLPAPDGRLERFEAIEAQLARLDIRLRELEASPPTSHRTPASIAGTKPLVGERFAALAERLGRLEASENARRQLVVQQVALVAEQRLVAQVDKLAAAQAIIHDSSTTDSEKAHAWLDLAGQDTYPWTDEIIALMTQIGATSKNDRAREVVWIGVDTQHRNNLLVQPLIAALSDPVANVREEAADALGHYLNVPGVRNALLWTSKNDTSAKVREEALGSLREGG